MNRWLLFAVLCLGYLQGWAQPSPVQLRPIGMSEEVGVAMNKAQVLVAAEQVWANTFGQEPGARLLAVDGNNGTIEGTARVNYRSTILANKEETMGSITYLISIQARNGQCNVRVHGFKHTGNRSATGGGLNMGALMEGEAPAERYPGVGLGLSQRMHNDARKVALNRSGEVLRAFVSRLRGLSPP